MWHHRTSVVLSRCEMEDWVGGNIAKNLSSYNAMTLILLCCKDENGIDKICSDVQNVPSLNK